MVVLVPSKNLNPEDKYYYQTYEPNSYRDVKAEEMMDKSDSRPMALHGCKDRNQEDVDKVIKNFVPHCKLSRELSKTLNVERIRFLLYDFL